MCDTDKNCIAFVNNMNAQPPYCVFKASLDTMYERPDHSKNVHVKDDTVDFETHMTPSRSRHCQCAQITYVPDDEPISDCGDLEDGAPCSDGNAITTSDTCHAGVCESLSSEWIQTPSTQCAAFLPMDHTLVTLALAEAKCLSNLRCGAISDLYCNGMYAGTADHYALCDLDGTMSDSDGTCIWPKPGGTGISTHGGGGH
eukprot:SAG31_NODE_4660_length_3059_cov_2.381081_4_plen_200_part_00